MTISLHYLSDYYQMLQMQGDAHVSRGRSAGMSVLPVATRFTVVSLRNGGRLVQTALTANDELRLT